MNEMATLAPDKIAALIDALGDIPHSIEPGMLRRKSRDYYWTSPVLKQQLDQYLADLVAFPRNETDVIAIAGACVQLKIPLTVRGQGTGNYGQAVPTQGGVVLDTSSMNAILAITEGAVRAQAGVLMGQLDKTARASGLEVKHFPSTKRTASLGGYFAGGSAGVGAVAHGGLREPGNLTCARIVTLEDTPRALELSGPEAAVVLHTFGTMGVVTELTVPLTPARSWLGLAIAFADRAAAVRFANVSAIGPLTLKLLSVLDMPLTTLMKGFAELIGGPADVVIAMIDASEFAQWQADIDAAGGRIAFEQGVEAVEADGSAIPIYEYTYGHASLMALKSEPSLSYAQIICPLGQVDQALAMLDDRYGAKVLHHLEYMIFDGEMYCALYPMLRNTTPEQVDEMAAACEAFGLACANPHISTVEGGSGYKRLPIDLAGFKARIDPYGLLNPGKF